LLGTLIAARLLLGLIFLGSAASKVLDPGRLPRVIRSYALLPERAIKPAAVALTIAELGLGVALLGGWRSSLVGACAAGLLLVFAAAIAVNAVRRTTIDCGCGGWEGPIPVGWPMVARNLLLASVAAVVAADPPESLPSLLRQDRVEGSAVIAFALCAGLILVVSAVARSAVGLLRVTRAVIEALPSAKTS
jgi:hypothetical protein